jgi:excisionase family DNA binding protein
VAAPHIPPEFYTTTEVASVLRVDPATVRNWVRAGRLPATATPGGRHLVPRAAVEAALTPAPERKPPRCPCYDFPY